MCSTVYGRRGDGEIYEIYSCGDLAAAIDCKLEEIVQRGERLDLDPDECLCNIDVIATAEQHGKSAAEDDWGDYEIMDGDDEG